MIKLEIKGRRVFTQFLITYFILVAAVCWPFYPLFSRTLSTVKESMLNDSYNTLEIGFLDIDSQILKFYEAAYTLSVESSFSELLRISGYMQTKDYYKLINTQKYLMNMVFPSEIVMDIGVMFEKNEFIITKNSIYTNHLFMYPKVYGIDGKSFEEWKNYLFDSKDLINIKASLPITYGTQTTYPEGVRDTVPCIIPLPMTGIREKSSVIFFLLDQQLIIQRLLSEELLNDGFLYVLDKNGAFILSHNYEGAQLSLAEGGVSETQMNGQKMNVMRVSSRETGLEAVIGVPDSLFAKRLGSSVSYLLFYLTAALLLGIVMSLFFAHSQYRPVKGLMNAIGSRMGRTGRKNENEYDYLKDVFYEMNQTNEAYKKQLDTLENSIKINITQKILTQGSSGAQEELAFAQYHQVENTYFCVILMDAWVTEDVQEDVTDRVQRAHLLAAESVRSKISHNKILCNLERERMAIIINLSEADQSHLSGMGDILRSIARDMEAQSGVQITFRVSSVGMGIENISSLYHQIKNIPLFDYRDNSDPVCFYVKADRLEVPDLFDPMIGLKLHDLILMGKTEQVNKLFDKMKKHLRKYKLTGDSDARQIYYAVRNVVEAAAGTLLKEDREQVLPKDGEIRDLAIDAILDRLEETAVRLCLYVEAKKRSKNEEMKQSIADYIRENFNNPDMCVAMVSEAFQLSEKYLFSLVREQTGKSFGDYLEALRLKKAEELLRNTDIKINQIHTKVGFNSQNTFYKAFNRVYEISPGQWRSHNRPDESL